ncbi:PREDICTED: actin-like protein 7B [Calidris pugnax]|uniref:actin-like protein 7B n=1 Tax=Calidris pugnax TaxID=198806 RepID=UPI00071CA524|nr:PREDICTED: actin-like protein 7B [Calidris pugnax]
MKRTRTVVVDIGTGSFKCGFAGDAWPSHVISSTVGTPVGTAERSQKETFVGRDLQNSSAPLMLANPVRHGIVVDWNCVQDTLEYIFQTEMKIQPEDHAVLVSVPPVWSITDKERYAEMMFEGFHVPAFHMAYQSCLSMYSYGKTSALVVESGHGASHVVPVYEGYTIRGFTKSVDYAGLDITHYLMKLLNESGNVFTEHQLNIVQDLKEKCCYASLNPRRDLRMPIQKQQVDYELPDQHVITVGKERFICAEALFNPALLGSQQPGLLQLTLTSLKKCNAAIKKKMVRNILLCGGNTMMEGFADRFQMELAKRYPADKPIAAASPRRKSSVWIGGSILASLHSFQELYVYSSEYEEYGPSCIFNKCF